MSLPPEGGAPGRTYEHAQAMLIALAKRSPASAEALGRIVVEASVNMSCLALRGDAGTLVQIFQVWPGEHKRKLTEWKAKMPASSGDADMRARLVRIGRKRPGPA